MMLKKKDIILIFAVVLVAGVIALLMNYGKKESPESVRIMIDGKEYGSYSLYEDREIDIENQYGVNRLVIKEASVHMEYADCPDKYCVEHRAISRAGEAIVCLPHKLVAEITGTLDNSSNYIDSVSQ